MSNKKINGKSSKFIKFVEKLKEQKRITVERSKTHLSQFINRARFVIDNKNELNEQNFKSFLENIKGCITDQLKNWHSNNIMKSNLFEYLKQHEKDRINIFEAFGNNESRYRDILVWLLDSNASHGLGNRFCKIFLDYIAERKGDKDGNKTLLTENELNNIIIKPEFKNIDIVIWNEYFFCAVEMKISSPEGRGKKQTTDYEKALNKDINFQNKRGFYIFLDPKLDPSIPPHADPNPTKHNQPRSPSFKRMDWWELSWLFLKLLEYQDINKFTRELVNQFIITNLTTISRYFYDYEDFQHIQYLDKLIAKGEKNARTNF